MIEISEQNGAISIYNIKDFHPVHTFLCGQCFRWDEEEDGSFTGIAYGKVVNVSYADGVLVLKNATVDDFNSIWRHYLDFNRDYTPMKNELSKDDNLKKAIDYGYGIRILNQQPWECLVSFIISTQNQIPRIKKIVAGLCHMYGKEILLDGKTYYTFPDATDLKNITEEDIASLKAGYRAGYIIDAVRKVNDGEVVLEDIFDMDYETAKKELMKIKGVGEKVADCVLLFAYGKSEAFPVDVWVTKVMRKLYLGDGASIKEIRKESKVLFGNNAGLAQQYLFYYARDNKL